MRVLYSLYSLYFVCNMQELLIFDALDKFIGRGYLVMREVIEYWARPGSRS